MRENFHRVGYFESMASVEGNLLRKHSSILIDLMMVLGLGLILGIVSIRLPSYFVIVGIAGIIYIIVAWIWPEIALLGILLFTSTIFDIYSLPSIPIGIGNLVVSDILILVLLGIIFLRVLNKSASYLIRTPLDIPLLSFYCTAIIATVVGIYAARVTFNQSLGEVRIVNFFLTFFIVTNLVRNEKQLRRLYRGIILLGLFVGLAMIAQYILGNSVQILPGRVETLSTAGDTSHGVTRVLPPGQSLVMLSLVCLVVQMLFDKKAIRFVTYLMQIGIVGLAVLLTFNRSFWTAIVLSLIIVSLLISLRDNVKYVQSIFLIILIAGGILMPFLSVEDGEVGKLIEGITTRMGTLFNPDTSEEDSLVYRYIEDEYAFPQIIKHPLIGLGLGANYRPLDPRIDFGPARYSLTYYIHNGHLWFMLKTGIVGYLFFIWFLLLFVKRGFKMWKQIQDPTLRGVVLAFVAIIPGILIASTVNPIIKHPYWTPVIGVMLGMGEAILRASLDESKESQILEELS